MELTGLRNIVFPTVLQMFYYCFVYFPFTIYIAQCSMQSTSLPNKHYFTIPLNCISVVKGNFDIVQTQAGFLSQGLPYQLYWMLAIEYPGVVSVTTIHRTALFKLRNCPLTVTELSFHSHTNALSQKCLVTVTELSCPSRDLWLWNN